MGAGKMAAEDLNGMVHVSDERVKKAVEEVTKAACAVLDELFPGGDAGGVSSDFQGRLEEVLTMMLNGRDPKQPSVKARGLRPLALSDQDFGRPDSGGFAYYVVRVEDGWVMDWEGKGFVKPRREQEDVDAYERFDAAVQGAIACMRSKGMPVGSVKVVGVSEAAYRAHGALGSRQEQKLDGEFTPAAVEVCSCLDFRLISDLDEDESGQTRAVYALGTQSDPDAGLARVVGTPWFVSVLDLDLFCAQHLAGYQSMVDEPEYPSEWFWEKTVAQPA